MKFATMSDYHQFLLALLGIALTHFGALARFVWSLHQKQRERMEKAAEEQRIRNDLRHEQNRTEFQKIYVALTQLGWRNGVNKPDPDHG